MADVACASLAQRIVWHESPSYRVARRRKLTIRLVHEVRPQVQHHGGLPPSAVRILGEGAAFFGGEPAPERRLDLLAIAAAEKLPREVSAERGHRDATPP